jgi:uncharacterized protein YgiM (DUF1202 family)
LPSTGSWRCPEKIHLGYPEATSIQLNVNIKAQGHCLTLPHHLRKRIYPRLLLAVALAGVAGCSHFRIKPSEKYVYVTAKQTFLRDRVAAVSNRMGTVANGEKLVVLDRARRFLKVRTPSGEVGWIEERQTAGQDVADKFEALGKEHEKDPVVATATASDEVYLHVAPGRETERFYLLAENDSLSLPLRRWKTGGWFATQRDRRAGSMGE